MPVGTARRRRTATTVVLALLALLSSMLLPVGDATAAGPPRSASGVYTGPCKTADAAAFAARRGRANAVVVDTLDMRRFANIARPEWWTGCWGAGTPMVYGVAMVTYEDGGSLAAGARGAYDEHFRALAERLVRGGQSNAWLRLGFEFNGKWFPWRAAADPAAFTAYYRRIADVMRSVPGQRFTFVWNPTIGVEEIPAERVWPGARYVDAIGLDVYDGSWAPGTYPVPRGASAAETRTRQDRAWHTIKTMDHGLDWWSRFAAVKRKPLALPEWGLVERPRNGGGDNPLFIERMRAWIDSNDVAFESYFNAVGAWGDHRLHSGKFPRAEARYNQLFGSEAATVRPAPAPATRRPGTTYTARLRTAVRALRVTAENNAGWSPSRFGRWRDGDRDCQDTRHEALIRTSTIRLRYGAGRCTVTGGRWVSLLDGKVYGSPAAVRTDHLVPAAEAWGSGARVWTAARRASFYNDLGVGYALLPVPPGLSAARGGAGPERWMPPANRCRYVEQWTSVKHRWALTVDPAERTALLRHADSCPDRALSVPLA